MASRFPYYSDTTESEAALWEATVKRALAGKRGGQMLREIEAALLALPAPRLIAGYVCHEGEVCAIGAYALKRRIDGGVDRESALHELERWSNGGIYETAYLGESLGLMKTVAYQVAYENDEGSWKSETPEDRYERVLRWVRSKIQDGAA